MYSAASSSSSIVALGPRLSSTGRVRFADGFEQPVVLHVAGADLQHVGVFGDEVDVFGGDDFGDDGEAGFVAGRGQQLAGLLLSGPGSCRGWCAA